MTPDEALCIVYHMAVQRLKDHRKIDIVTEEMKEAGSQIAAELFDAQVSRCLGGTGGSKEWEVFEASYNGENVDLVKQYWEEELVSVEAIYMAMRRAFARSQPTAIPTEASKALAMVGDLVEKIEQGDKNEH
jgi:hypothetical protein